MKFPEVIFYLKVDSCNVINRQTLF